MLFTNFASITNPAATTQALITYATTVRKMDENEITRQANAANPRVWASEACAAMNIDGNSSNAISDAMVELCEVASGITAILVAQLGSVDFRRIEKRVNAVVLGFAS